MSVYLDNETSISIWLRSCASWPGNKLSLNYSIQQLAVSSTIRSVLYEFEFDPLLKLVLLLLDFSKLFISILVRRLFMASSCKRWLTTSYLSSMGVIEFLTIYRLSYISTSFVCSSGTLRSSLAVLIASFNFCSDSYAIDSII
jgi:hypothetical protein